MFNFIYSMIWCSAFYGHSILMNHTTPVTRWVIVAVGVSLN
jgi:hypothetical protein